MCLRSIIREVITREEHHILCTCRTALTQLAPHTLVARVLRVTTNLIQVTTNLRRRLDILPWFGHPDISNIIDVDRHIGNHLDQEVEARDCDGCDDAEDDEGYVLVQRLVRVDTVRNGLAERLKAAEETTGARGGLDVCRERAENPEHGELKRVAKDEEEQVGHVSLDPGSGVPACQPPDPEIRRVGRGYQEYESSLLKVKDNPALRVNSGVVDAEPDEGHKIRHSPNGAGDPGSGPLTPSLVVENEATEGHRDANGNDGCRSAESRGGR